MIYRKIVAMLLVAGCLTAEAAVVTRQAARVEAESFLRSRGIAMPAREAAHKSLTPRVATATAAGEESYYVFNVGNDNGFVIVSGDDRTAPVLGYAESGSFPEGDLPDGLRWLLERYADEIAHLTDAPATGTDLRTVAPAGDMLVQEAGAQQVEHVKYSIRPILTTKWNQDAPYNNKCPKYYSNGSLSTDNSATGCAATAMSQVLYHYKHPASLKAQIPGYTYTSGTHTMSMPAIAAGTAIDWDNMLPVYTSGSYTTVQGDAVANLMVMVGTALTMNYGAESGANYYYGFQTLVDCFGYSDAMVAVKRGSRNIGAWIDLLYNELSNGFPVLYDGFSSGGGHAFVIDGYDEDDLFHVNWGWGGHSDGYFRISVLCPDDNSGIGASSTSDGYAKDQSMVLNLRVADDGSVVANSADLCSLSLYSFSYSGTTISAQWANFTGFDVTADYGLGFKDADGNIVPLSFTNHASLSTGYGYKVSFDLSSASVLANFPSDGTYKVYPITRASGSDQWNVTAPYSNTVDNAYFIVTVSNGQATVSYPEGELTLVSTETPGNLKTNEQQEIRATFAPVSATDEYYGQVYCFIGTSKKIGSTPSASTSVTIRGGGRETVSFYYKPTTASTYHVWFTTDAAGKHVIGTTSFAITAAGVSVGSAAITGGLQITDFNFRNWNSTAKEVYGHSLDADITVKNTTSSAIHGTVYADHLFYQNNGWYHYNGAGIPITVDIAAGAAQNVTVHVGDFDFESQHSVQFLYEVGGSTNITGGAFAADRQVTMKPGVMAYSQDDVVSVAAPSASLAADAAVATYDLTGLTGVTSVTPSTNAGTLFVIDAAATVPSGLSGRNVVHGTAATSIALTDACAFISPVSFTADDITYTYTIPAGCQAEWQTLTLPFAPETITVDGQTMALRTTPKDPSKLAVREFIQMGGTQVQFQYATALVANRPYVLNIKLLAKPDRAVTVVFSATDAAVTATEPESKATTSQHDFIGTTISDHVSGSEVYVLNTAGTAFEPLEPASGSTTAASPAKTAAAAATAPTATVSPFRAYFRSKLAEAERLEQIPIRIISTGIEAVTGDDSAEPREVPVYNIAGALVGHATVCGTAVTLPAVLPRGVYIAAGIKVVK